MTAAPDDDPLLPDSLDVGPDIDAESWRLRIPARPACYLLEDERGTPIIAAAVADARGALMRRLGPDAPPEDDDDPEEGATKPSGGRKIDYRAVTRRVRFRPVFSKFEGNWTYLELVRERFPDSYRKLIRPWRAWWLGADPDAAHPTFDIRDRPFGPPDTCFGPFPTQKAARRCAEMLEDLFDLCRYPHVLAQSPRGQACAYKEMNRCPAPCDGSVPMESYRTQVAAAAAFMTDGPDAFRADVTQRMKAAAAERAFEQAARFKAMLDASKVADDDKAAFVRPLPEFRYLALQPGDRKGRVRLFLIAPALGMIGPFTPAPDPGSEHTPEPAPQDSDSAPAPTSTPVWHASLQRGMDSNIVYLTQLDPKNRTTLLPQLTAHLDTLRTAPLPDADIPRPAADRIGLLAWHLLAGDRDKGVYHHLDTIPDATTLAAALDAFNDNSTASDPPDTPDPTDAPESSDDTPDPV